MGIPTSIGNSLPAIIITKSASPAINPNDAAVPAGSPPIGAVASASNEALSADQIPTDTLLAYTMPPVVTTDTPATLADIPTVLTDKTTVLDLSQTAPTQTMFGIKQFNLPDIQLDKSNLMVLQNTNQTYLQRYTLDNQSQLTVKPDSPTGSTSGMSWTDVSVANNSSANVIASGSGNLNFNGTNTSTGGTITLNTNSNNAVSFHISSNGKDNASTNATNQLSLTTQGGNDQINLGKTLSNGTFTQTNLQGLSGTINTGAGNDVVTLSALDDANTNLIIDGGDGKDTVVATGSDKDWKLAAIMVDDDGNTVSTVENQNTKALYQLKNIEEFRFASGGGLSLTDKPLREIKGPGEVVKNPTTPEEIANDPRPLTLVNGQAVLTNEVNYISQINPVFGETSQQTLQRILNDAPPPPTARPGWIPKLKGLQPGQGPSTYVPQYVLARTYTPEQKQNIIDASLAADTDGQFTPESLGKMLNEFPEEWDPADTEPPPSGLPVIVGKVTHSYEIPGRLIDNPQEVFTPRRENSTFAQKDMPLFGMMGGPEKPTIITGKTPQEARQNFNAFKKTNPNAPYSVKYSNGTTLPDIARDSAIFWGSPDKLSDKNRGPLYSVFDLNLDGQVGSDTPGEKSSNNIESQLYYLSMDQADGTIDGAFSNVGEAVVEGSMYSQNREAFTSGLPVNRRTDIEQLATKLNNGKPIESSDKFLPLLASGKYGPTEFIPMGETPGRANQFAKAVSKDQNLGNVLISTFPGLMTLMHQEKLPNGLQNIMNLTDALSQELTLTPATKTKLLADLSNVVDLLDVEESLAVIDLLRSIENKP
jgi:hypothetical protein